MAEQSNGGAVYLIPRCEALRQARGKTINRLAKTADVDRSRVTMIERGQPVTGPVAGRVFQVLNEWHGNQLKFEVEVVKGLSAKNERR